MEANQNTGSELSLRWIYVAWLSLVFTWLVFIVCGVIGQGDPTQLIERVFGDIAMFAMAAYIIGLLIAVLFLCLLLRKRGLGRQSIGLRGHLTKRGVLYAVLGCFAAFLLFYIVENIAGHAGIRMFWNELVIPRVFT